jgi:hypothetical protein
MLDVHPPHEAVHTWKDFFIHIATIVIGLLIAIGLEQTVEYFHHRDQVKDAHQLLAEEMDHNREILKQALYSIRMHEQYLFTDLPVIERIRTHSVAPTDIVVLWHPHPSFEDSAWNAIHGADASSLIPYEELRDYGIVYTLQHEYYTVDADMTYDLMGAGTAIYHSPADRFNYASASAIPHDWAYGVAGEANAHAAFENQAPNATQLTRLTPTEVDRLQTAVQHAILVDDTLIARLIQLQSRYDKFAGK